MLHPGKPQARAGGGFASNGIHGPGKRTAFLTIRFPLIWGGGNSPSLTSGQVSGHIVMSTATAHRVPGGMWILPTDVWASPAFPSGRWRKSWCFPWNPVLFSPDSVTKGAGGHSDGGTCSAHSSFLALSQVSCAGGLVFPSGLTLGDPQPSKRSAHI